MPTLIAYNRIRATELLRTCTAQQVFDDVYAGRFRTTLTEQQAAELGRLTGAWVQRALGPMTLRDALLIDPRRGACVYNLICASLTVGRVYFSDQAAAAMRDLGSGEVSLQQAQALLARLRTIQPDADDDSAALLQQANTNQLALVYYAEGTGDYPFPTDLDSLLPPPPVPFPRQIPPFEQPTGLRRNMAIGLVLMGVGLLGIPLVMGHMPTQPAGVPLALLTLALLVGIKAHWPGYTGAVCIWFVANLPGFHHDTLTTILWPGIPLVLCGIILLVCDRQVRALWHAIWGSTKRTAQNAKRKAQNAKRKI